MTSTLSREGYERLFRALADGALPDALYLHDFDGRFFEVNQRACDMLGYSREQLLSMGVTDVETDYDLAALQAMWVQVVPGQSQIAYGHNRRRDGALIPVQISVVTVATDSPRLYLAVLRDLTQPERLAAALHESELRFAAVFEESHVAIAITRVADSRIVDVNPAFETLYGYTRHELIGHTPQQLQLWADPADRDELLRRVRAGEPVISFVGRLRRKSGELGYVHASVRQIDVQGAPHIVSMLFDVTEQRRAEALLRESEERYRILFMTNPDSLVVNDVDDERLVDLNEAFCRTFGWPRADVVGRNGLELGLWADPADRAAYVTALRRDRRCDGFEATLRARDGRPYRMLLYSRLFEAGGQRRALTVFRDVTEQRRTEAELETHRHHLEELVGQRTQELVVARDVAERASRAKSLFLANMSHEIRTPMNGVLGVAHLLRRTGLSAAQAGYVDKITMAGGHLLEIINSVLDLSKIEAGKLELADADVDVYRIASDVAALIADDAHGKGLALEVDVAPLPRGLRGDATRLKQALLNLATNAVKFTARGKVTIRARQQDADDTGVHVLFEVEDTGIGIAPEVAQRLFAAFEQGDASTTRAYGGTGLGLVITRRIAELMDGSAGLQSEPGRGSRFWFSARLRRGEAHAGAAPVARSLEALVATLRALAPGRRLLVVEDNLLSAEILLQFLADAALQADVVGDGERAVRAAAAQRYDLILMDWQLPVLDGLAATRRIRELAGYADVPILALTASAYADDRQACLAAGMNGFLTKPVEPALLYAELCAWLRDRA